MPGHLYGYQLAHGVIPRLGWDNDSPTACHTCDNHSCQQPRHLRLGTPAENRAEWLARGPPDVPARSVQPFVPVRANHESDQEVGKGDANAHSSS
ncbi:hypothetical protein [Streptomyces sp. Rer75]|uniref:hypothetical protein n=1 Tax=Streptomyces sp. Rer75 TaxID=2750011 RepID=UPI00211E1D5E|nr:hypothetical protein [Streptomyces sp. Rer75]